MDYEKKQPTADCIVARLVPSWGSIVSLLFKATEPYEHYYDEHGEEVPYGAIESWTDVELPPEPESEDEKMIKAIEHVLYENYYDAAIIEGVEIAEIVAWLEKHKEQKPNGAIVEESFNEGDGFYRLNLAYLSKEQIEKVEKLVTSWNSKEQKPVSGSSEKPNNHKEWSEKDKTIIESACYALELWGHTKLAEMLKSLRPQPHWKPSEEQMKALETVIKCELSASMYTRAGILQTLQNDLKKL